MTDQTPTPVPVPAPAPTPAASKANVILHDVRVVLMGVVTAGETILVSLPTGPVHDAFQVGLPLAAAVATALMSLGD